MHAIIAHFGFLPASMNQPYRFSAKRHYAGLGMSYYGFRFYSPGLGRWINRDPIGENGGLNLYGFVGNSPVNAIDPYGLTDASVSFVNTGGPGSSGGWTISWSFGSYGGWGGGWSGYYLC